MSPQVTLAVTPRTGNSHEVGGEFPDHHIDLFVCWFPEYPGKYIVGHVCPDAVRWHSVGHGGRLVACRSVKGMCHVGANNDSDDANEEGRGKSVWCFCVGGQVKKGQ